jgi:diacylglycerol kinase family enzyme
MHAVLIENPKAGRVSPGSLRVVERALEATFDLELATTNARGHAAALAREAVDAGAKTIIAYGGDGTANEILNGVLGRDDATEIVLAVLPGGTTNVLARNLGYPNDLVEATARLISIVDAGEPKHLTIGRISAESEHGHLERDFAFAAGLVLDAEIVRRVDKMKRRRKTNDGTFLYFGWRAFFALRKDGKPQLVVDTPDGPQDAYWACIAAADPYTYFRSRPLHIVPGTGEASDGLGLIAGQQLKVGRTLRWLQQSMGSARHIRHKDALHLFGCDSIHLHAHRPVPLQTDGEYLGDVTEVTATALRKAVPVWA